MIATGRKERMANIYFIASNGFIVEYFDSDEDGKDNNGGDGDGGESAEDESSPKKRIENVEIIGDCRSFWISKKASMS